MALGLLRGTPDRMIIESMRLRDKDGASSGGTLSVTWMEVERVREGAESGGPEIGCPASTNAEPRVSSLSRNPDLASRLTTCIAPHRRRS